MPCPVQYNNTIQRRKSFPLIVLIFCLKGIYFTTQSVCFYMTFPPSTLIVILPPLLPFPVEEALHGALCRVPTKLQEKHLQ